MSAAELIEQIKALSPAELEEVRSFLLNGEGAQRPPVQYISKEKFKVAADHVFEVHGDLLRKLAD